MAAKKPQKIRVHFLASEREVAAWRRASGRGYMTLSQWMRIALDRAVKENEKEKR